MVKHAAVHRNALYEAIGDALVEMRRLRDVSAAQAAEAAGIGASVMQKYEQGIAPAPVHVLASLARFYGVTMNELVPITAYRRTPEHKSATKEGSDGE